MTSPRRGLLAVLVAWAAFSGGEARAARPQAAPAAAAAPIVGRASVTDGDTFWIGRQKIRVWGIDAPDDDRKSYGTRALRQILRDRTLTCRPSGRSWDRLVARCVDQYGGDIAAEMVATGWALDWPSFSKGRYRAAEARAQARRVGVFATDGPLWGPRAPGRPRGGRGA